MSEPAAPDPTDRSRYPAWARDTVRYADTDRQGHVNNAVFATFCETGRVHVLYRPDRLAPPGCEFVLARLALDYRAEINWPGEVEIGTGVKAVGRSSVTIAQALFQEGRCVATAETVVVLMDEATRRSTPLPDKARAHLATLTVRDPQPTAS